MSVGDSVIRRYDAKLGRIEFVSKARNYYFVRFWDGTCMPVHRDHLRLCEVVVS
jgi:hypothetical protein